MSENVSLSEFGFTGGGVDYPPRVNLRNIEGKPFTVTAVRDTPTKDHGYGPNPDAVTITTKEAFDVEGAKYSNFLVTWGVVTEKLKSEKLRDALSQGKSVGPLKLVKVHSDKTKRDYYDIADA